MNGAVYRQSAYSGMMDMKMKIMMKTTVRSVPDGSDINVCPNFSDKLILDVGVILNFNHSVAQICIENQHLISPTADKCVQK